MLQQMAERESGQSRLFLRLSGHVARRTYGGTYGSTYVGDQLDYSFENEQ